ncbi:beta-L-arabinofuranosidase domain-containing protein [Dinghuibacter silviterrae]|nr:beta-L-arabinofuranosidase domain-containing protein [Dinghuibacter silviterrae]
MRGAAAALLAAFALDGSQAQGTGPDTRVKAAPAVQRVETEVPLKDITAIGGFAGDRIRKNEAHYLDTFSIEKYVALIQNPATTAWDWRPGEQPGKWLEASILATQRVKDKALEEKAKTMYERILNAQGKDGYVGVTSPSIRTPDNPLRGMDAYELHFLLHALLTGYEDWQDVRGLTAAERLGDYFLRFIGPGKAGFWPGAQRPPENKGVTFKGTQHSAMAGHSVHYGWEGTLLVDPMMRLYEVSGDRRYLDWCRWVVRQIDTWSGWDAFSKLGRMPVNEVQPYAHAHTFQMNFLGFLRLYRATGDTALLHKVEAVWDDVASRQMYLTGGVSVGEHYEKDFVKPLTGKMMETCATMSWMQLSQALLELTGETKYADVIERALWNQVFAAQAIDGNAHRYNTPPDGVVPEGFFRDPDCCSGSGERLETMLPAFIYAVGARHTVFINQFVASTVTLTVGQAVRLTQTTDYPSSGRDEIDVRPAKAATFTLEVRIPSWCTGASVSVNGVPIPGVHPGHYLPLTRQWAPGDKVVLDFPMQLSWVRHEHYMKTADKKPYKTEPDADAPYALVRGPLVYAADDMWYARPGDSAAQSAAGTPGPFGKDLFSSVKYVLVDPATFAPVAHPEPDLLGPGFMVPFETANGQRFTMPVYPFANIGKWYKDPAQAPGRDSAAYAYAVWLKGTAKPDVVLPNVLGSDMVLQRRRPVPVWGRATPGETVTVSFGGQQKTAPVASDGRWMVYLDPMEASAQPRQMVIRGRDSIVLDDVLVGEVWLCSGQSNMEFTMMKSAKFENTLRYPAPRHALDSADNAAIRIFLVHRGFSKAGTKAPWDTAEGRALRTFSAVGYFFAQSLYDHLHVPIGMIDASVSGSHIEPWLPGNGTYDTSSSAPGKFYDDMIEPLAPFALKGFLWYQGETNCFLGETEQYTDKMVRLVTSWRALWKDTGASFYYVQLPPYEYSKTKGLTTTSLPAFREAQTRVLALPHTGMIVTTDLVDDLSQLHPSYKWIVGRRLARWALAKDYGQDIVYSGPLYTVMELRKRSVALTFTHGPLDAGDGKPLTCFSIAGRDGQFVPAQAEIRGDKVIVSGVRHPTAVRFAWSEDAQPNLFNEAGLPAAPFRTDEAP